jgi:hypothetical protein
MSHIATLNVEIKELAALKISCRKLGLEFMEGQQEFKSYFPGKCDHAIRVIGKPNAYEIGVTKNKSGVGYSLSLDPHCGGYGLIDAVGYNGEKLKQRYAAEVARKAALRAGLRGITETVKKDGTIVLKVRA